MTTYPAALLVIAPYPAPAGYAFALILFFGTGRGRIAHRRTKSNRGEDFPAAIAYYASPSRRAAVATHRHSASPSAVGRAMASAVHFTLPVSL